MTQEERLDYLVERFKIDSVRYKDLRTPEDVRALCARCPGTEAVMIGRGLLADPALILRCRGNSLVCRCPSQRAGSQFHEGVQIQGLYAESVL